jgi:hypothetical protein
MNNEESETDFDRVQSDDPKTDKRREQTKAIRKQAGQLSLVMAGHYQNLTSHRELWFNAVLLVAADFAIQSKLTREEFESSSLAAFDAIALQGYRAHTPNFSTVEFLSLFETYAPLVREAKQTLEERISALENENVPSPTIVLEKK